MNWTEFTEAVQEAHETMAKADAASRRTAHLLKDRLRAAEIDRDTLRSLKRELTRFNATTGRWTDKP